MKFRSIAAVFAAIVMLTVTSVTHAAVLVTANPKGNGVWVLSGSGLTDVAGLSIVITYDKNKLSSPTVTQGGGLPGGMFIANPTTTPGVIRIAWISTTPLTNDGGDLATLSFRFTGSGTDGLTGITPTVTNSKMDTENGSGTINNPVSSGGETGAGSGSSGVPSSGSSGVSSSGSSGGTGTVSGSSNVAGGSVAIPGSPFGEESRPSTPPPAPEPQTQAPAPAAPEPQPAPAAEERKPEAPKPAAVAKPKFVKVPSVLETFRTYKGEETLAALTALFNPRPELFRQEPPVVLSDGKATALLRVKIPADSSEAPNFAFRGAHFVSMSRDADEWIIEVQPDESAISAEAMIIAGPTEMEIPVTVAPPVDLRKTMKKNDLSEGVFQLFKKERGTEKAPLYDLNNDGRRDFTDDYIFVANYLAFTQAPKTEGKKE